MRERESVCVSWGLIKTRVVGGGDYDFALFEGGEALLGDGE